MKLNNRCSILFIIVAAANPQLQLDLIGKLLQSHLPKTRSATVATTAVCGDQQLASSRKPSTAHFLPPASNEARAAKCRVVINSLHLPTLDCSLHRRPHRNSRPNSGSLKSCTRTSSGSPTGCHSCPGFLKSPSNSFFFVSTDTTGCPRRCKRLVRSLMYSN